MKTAVVLKGGGKITMQATCSLCLET